MNSKIRGRGAKSFGNGRHFIRNSATCRANSRLPSPARRATARHRWSTTWACTSYAARAANWDLRSLPGAVWATPIIGQVVREFLPREHLLSYLEAVLRV